MLARFSGAGPVGRSTGIAFGTVAKLLLGCNKLKAWDHQTWKMGPCKKDSPLDSWVFHLHWILLSCGTNTTASFVVKSYQTRSFIVKSHEPMQGQEQGLCLHPKGWWRTRPFHALPRIGWQWAVGHVWCGWRIYSHVGCNHSCLQLFMIQKSIHLDLILSESW